MCHQLFADDLGIFILATKEAFRKLHSILHTYELASIANVNLAKIVIIPLTMPNMQQWLVDTGCKIGKPGEIQKYLGAPIGHQLKISMLHDFCLDKISKCIKGWSNCLLSFTRKTPLIQHVLQSIAICHMMYIACQLGQSNRLIAC